MLGQGKDLQAAGERFAAALPITRDLIDAAEGVLAAIEGEIEQGRTQIERFRVSDPNPDGGTEVAIAIRQGAETALTAERSRWRRILNVLREVPPRGIDPSGSAYFKSQKPD
ncbi:hypothetical protein OG921_12770 [Aldersonia sp. NBC_00410]|uniref:hypothetical protein n=1 Tax=Aldersonia sp. NBC_00410 TaxID=2975954 RepID=UPI002258C5F7|nr:hypothetical protein [Aldersonia sp. NBC_00410]MCX5044042.1 hypothetical protein [Aldersonia sp. NBC_00410]